MHHPSFHLELSIRAYRATNATSYHQTGLRFLCGFDVPQSIIIFHDLILIFSALFVRKQKGLFFFDMLRRLSSCTAVLAGLPASSIIVRHKTTKIANRRRTEMFHAFKYIVPTRLSNAAPHIAEEWDYDKNPLYTYPKIVGVAAMAKYWWRCRVCGKSFEESPERRVVRGYGCPHCVEAAKNQNVIDEAAPVVTETKKKSGKTNRRAEGSKRRRRLKKKRFAVRISKSATAPKPTGSVVSSSLAEPPSPSSSITSSLSDPLPGEISDALKSKRPPMFTNRTRY